MSAGSRSGPQNRTCKRRRAPQAAEPWRSLDTATVPGCAHMACRQGCGAQCAGEAAAHLGMAGLQPALGLPRQRIRRRDPGVGSCAVAAHKAHCLRVAQNPPHRICRQHLYPHMFQFSAHELPSDLSLQAVTLSPSVSAAVPAARAPGRRPAASARRPPLRAAATRPVAAPLCGPARGRCPAPAHANWRAPTGGTPRSGCRCCPATARPPRRRPARMQALRWLRAVTPGLTRPTRTGARCYGSRAACMEYNSHVQSHHPRFDARLA